MENVDMLSNSFFILFPVILSFLAFASSLTLLSVFISIIKQRKSLSKTEGEDSLFRLFLGLGSKNSRVAYCRDFLVNERLKLDNAYRNLALLGIPVLLVGVFAVVSGSYRLMVNFSLFAEDRSMALTFAFPIFVISCMTIYVSAILRIHLMNRRLDMFEKRQKEIMDKTVSVGE